MPANCLDSLTQSVVKRYQMGRLPVAVDYQVVLECGKKAELETIDTYSHITPRLQAAAAARFDEAFSTRYNKSESEAAENRG